ncbi:MAG: DUF1499 domain-containing protein [Propionivibrio sp.]
MRKADSNGRRWTSTLAWVALGAAIGAAIVALGTGPGYRLSWWQLGPAIQAMRWAAIVAMSAAVIGLIAAVVAFRITAVGPMRVALASVIVGLAVALPPLSLYLRAQDLPRIHDITTDPDHPPAFVATLPLRQKASNPTNYLPETATAQKSAYPDIAPKVLKMPPDEAFKRAENAAKAMGWQIVEISRPDHRIEATDTSLLFGFKDDIVIRLTPLADGTRIDVRSLSRVGGSDFGVNAKRIREFMRRLDSE